jgi:hypothetical protein
MKTAVEKFRESFYDYAEPYNGFSEEPKWTISEEDFEKLIQQAKSDEEMQIINTAVDIGCSEFHIDIHDAVQYYNETFKQQEQ